MKWQVKRSNTIKKIALTLQGMIVIVGFVNSNIKKLKVKLPERFFVGQLNEELDDLSGRELMEIRFLERTFALLVPVDPTLFQVGATLKQ